MRLPTEERFSRLLAVVPWVHSQGGATITETCERFGLEPADFVRDFNLLACCGVEPFTPDVLPLMFIEPEDDWVSVTYPKWYGDRLPLTPAEAFVLLANAQAMLSVPGMDPAGPLARALAKVAVVVGADSVRGLNVSLAAADPDVVVALRNAVENRTSVEIDYFSLTSGHRASRIIDPLLVFEEGSSWYVTAYCHAHGEQRTFNVDRIHAVRVLGGVFTLPPAAPEPASFTRRGNEPIIALDLAPDAAWVADTYPTESVERLDDGTIRVEMVVSNRRMFARLLIRLGPAATVVSAPPDLIEEAKATAKSILAAYDSPGPA